MISSEKIHEQEMVARLQEVSQIEELEVGGETSIEDEVIGAIAGIAAKEVDGVSSLGKQSMRRAIAEKVGGAEKRARGVGVEAGAERSHLGPRDEGLLWIQYPRDGDQSPHGSSPASPRTAWHGYQGDQHQRCRP